MRLPIFLFLLAASCSDARHLTLIDNPVHDTLNVRYDLAVVTCVRDRDMQLDIFKTFLAGKMKHAAYALVVVEQNFGAPFNRGWLMNVGFQFLMNNSFTSDIQTVIFHDVDMLATRGVEYKHFYKNVVHLATAVSQFGYKMPYNDYLSGVVAFRPAFYRKMNGYSNAFWGWGGEDDDLRRRVSLQQELVHRPENNGKVLSVNEGHTERDTREHAQNVQLLNKEVDPNDGLTNVQSVGRIREVRRQFNEWHVWTETFRKT